MVPATISKSAWRGEKRTTSAPKRAKSYFGPITDINSMPQQAVPNGIGHRAFFLPHARTLSSVVVSAKLDVESEISIVLFCEPPAGVDVCGFEPGPVAVIANSYTLKHF